MERRGIYLFLVIKLAEYYGGIVLIFHGVEMSLGGHLIIFINRIQYYWIYLGLNLLG